MSSYGLPLLGGVMIGLGVSLLLWVNGRTAGISGILGGMLSRSRGELGWRAAFVGGLVAAGLLLRAWRPSLFGVPVLTGAGIAIAAGVLVGFGTQLARGCTSGHGLCGISRGAVRSLVATGTFMVTGAITVLVVRRLLGGVL